MKVRLYLDEDVVPELARVLREYGHDVISAHEIGTLGLSDEEQLEVAAAQERAILSFNFTDFLTISRDWFLAGRRHAGIIVSYRQYSRREIGALARTVLALLNALTAEDLRGSVAILDQFHRD